MMSRERLAWALFTIAMIALAVILLWPTPDAPACWMPEDL